MSVVPAPSTTPSESIPAAAALVLAIAVLVAMTLQPERWGVPSSTRAEACTYNCLYMP